jgi:hypothetical protein
MAEAVAYFPNQRIEKLTQTLYLKEWKDIADRYSLQRFESALGNVLRRSQFFPMPHTLQAECEDIRKQTWVVSPSLHVWQCDVCGTTQASERAESCMLCKASHMDMVRLTPETTSDVDMKRYHERIRSNPEEFVRVADLFREAYDNVARRKMENAA